LCRPRDSSAAQYAKKDQRKTFYVYILASRSGTLYIGVTNDLGRRISEHKHELAAGFTSRYKTHRLVYLEEFDRVEQAMAREKQLKGWNRKKKIALIESMNPAMRELMLTERNQ
jgi:putative endonuclease